MVETKRQINKNYRLPRFVDNAIVFWLQMLGKFYAYVELLSPKNKETIISYFNECNAQLGEKYFDGEIAFQTTK